MNKFNKKGFTLIEMLVVIAIIAVLVSIVIPVVGDSTEKAREAKDAANIRSAIATVTTKAMTTGKTATESVTLTQTGDWESIDDIGGIEISKFPKTGTVYVSYSANATEVSISTTAPAASK